MFRAHVDTPWAQDSDGSYVPELSIDPSHSSRVKKWFDVTGREGTEVPPGIRLYGGNYAKATGIQPDHSVGRVGGSGDPDYLMIEVETETSADLDAINSDDKYIVFWQEEIVDA